MINRLKLTPTYAVLICSLTLLGCSSTVLHSPKDEYPDAFVSNAKAKQQLALATPSSDNLQQLTYQPLNSAEVQYIPFVGNSDVYNFATGKSFYKAYKLDADINKLNVTVSGLFYNTVFAPQVLLLDSQFNQTRIISSDKFVYKPAKLLNGDELSAEFIIKRPNLANPANETYFVIYSTPEAMQGETTITHPAKINARARSLVEPDIADPIIDHSAMGVVKLSFEITTKNDSYVALEQKASETYIATEQTTDAAREVAADNANELLMELQYNNKILKAINRNDIEEALQLVEEAEAKGSKSARTTFVEAIQE